MKEKLMIIGASGHSKVVCDIANRMNEWHSIAFLDDSESAKQWMGFQVVGKITDAFAYKDEADFIVAIGDNKIREQIQRKLTSIGIETVSLIHPNAVIGMDVEIGCGTVVMAGAIVNSASRIGHGCIINTNSSIDHDNKIADFVHVAPGVRTGGKVIVGKGTKLGIGSVIINNVSICENSLIGAGAVVVRDITEAGTYVGVPARKLIKEGM